MRGHITILEEFLNRLPEAATILDAGSGITSLAAITANFPDAQVDAVVYPGDERKLRSIRQAPFERVRILETDLCGPGVSGRYDLTVAHLLLGEASKFAHCFEELLSSLLSVDSRYYIIIDYAEDPGVDEAAIRSVCDAAPFHILDYMVIENEDPQVWEDFTGVHNFGYLIRRR